MPLENDLDKVLILGSGPSLIGSVSETDLPTTDAIKALIEEDIQVVLVNPNPATISTDKRPGVTVYLEPMNLDFLKRIIRMEEPDAIMTAFGSVSGLAIAHDLLTDGILEDMGIRLLTSNKQTLTINDLNQKLKFLESLNIKVTKYWQLIDELSKTVEHVKFPVLVTKRQKYMHNLRHIFNQPDEFLAYFKKEKQNDDFALNNYQLTEDLSSWQETIVDAIRDKSGNLVFINFADSIESIAINSGDSTMVMPSLTSNNDQIQELRSIVKKIADSLKLVGILSVHFAIEHQGTNFTPKVISVKTRVTRSALWAQKSSLYSVGYVVSKVAIGFRLNEIIDPLSNLTAAIEPVQDKITLKMPYWSLANSANHCYHLGRIKQSSGEAIGIGRNFEAAFLKALTSTTNTSYMYDTFSREKTKSKAEIKLDLANPDEMLLVKVLAAIDAGVSFADIQDIVHLHPFYYQKLQNIVAIGQKLAASKKPDTKLLLKAKKGGFSNQLIVTIMKTSTDEITKQVDSHLPVSYSEIDGSAGLYQPNVQAFYSSYDVENEAKTLKATKKVLIIGMLPSQVSVTSEFDYMINHATITLHNNGYVTVMLSNNDESVSNRYHDVDRMYFEPITLENILQITKTEKITDILVQFSGKEINSLSQALLDKGLHILGYQGKNIDRHLKQVLDLPFKNLKQNPMLITKYLYEVNDFIKDYDFPILIGGISKKIKQKSAVIYDLPALNEYLAQNELDKVTISHFIEGNKYEVTAISDGRDVTIPGIIEHLEQSGSHASDSIAVFKPQNLTEIRREEIKKSTLRLIKKLKMRGIFTLHFLSVEDSLYLLQVKPYAGHNVAFLSHALNKDITAYASEVLSGKSIKKLGYSGSLWPTNDFIHVKMPVFSHINYNSDNSFDSKMKSSGSVVGRDTKLSKALYKGYEASGLVIPSYGTIFVSVRDEVKEEAAQLARRFYRLGYKVVATEGTANVLAETGITTGVISKVHDDPNNLIEKIRSHKIVMVINITSLSDIASGDAIRIRDEALNTHIPVFSSIETTKLILEVLESLALTTQPI